MAGRPRKAPNALAGHRAGRAPLKLVPPSEPPPTPPPGLADASIAIWDRYWRAAVSSQVDRDSDLAAVERWIWYVDELGRARRAYRRQHMTKGSTGQPALHPIWRTIPSLEAMIRNLEEALGMTPIARRRLGYAIGGPATGRRVDAIEDLAADLDDPSDDIDFDG